MKNIKDTTIGCWCFLPAKMHTQRTLEREGLLIPKVYELLNRGEGLYSKYDDETARMIRDVVREARHLSFPFKTDDTTFSHLTDLREKLVYEGEMAVKKLYAGAYPIYLYHKYDCSPEELNAAYNHFETKNSHFYEQPKEIIIRYIKGVQDLWDNNDHKKAYIKAIKVAYTGRYTLRTTYEDKSGKGISDRLRALLDWIDDIPTQSKAADREHIQTIYDKIKALNAKKNEIRDFKKNNPDKDLPQGTTYNYLQEMEKSLTSALENLPKYEWKISAQEETEEE